MPTEMSNENVPANQVVDVGANLSKELHARSENVTNSDQDLVPSDLQNSPPSVEDQPENASNPLNPNPEICSEVLPVEVPELDITEAEVESASDVKVGKVDEVKVDEVKVDELEADEVKVGDPIQGCVEVDEVKVDDIVEAKAERGNEEEVEDCGSKEAAEGSNAGSEVW